MPEMTPDHRQIARDISYAGAAASRGGRALIRVLENVTGRPALIRRAQGYDLDVAQGRDFWSVMVDRYGLSLRVAGGALADIPREGPLIVIANHPYGVLDGLMMGHILHRARGDFRILANSVFRQARDLDAVLLPISFDETKAAVEQNLDTRRRTLAYLAQGGCVGIFPGGTVSTARRPFGVPMDPGWRGFTARMIARSGATVVPIYFAGHTSRMFQLASHLHANLRLGLLLKEFRARVDSPVDVVIGRPIAQDEIAARAKDTKAMMDFLRKSTYELSPKPMKSFDYGFEFEERHRAPRGTSQ